MVSTGLCATCHRAPQFEALRGSCCGLREMPAAGAQSQADRERAGSHAGAADGTARTPAPQADH